MENNLIGTTCGTLYQDGTPIGGLDDTSMSSCPPISPVAMAYIQYDDKDMMETEMRGPFFLQLSQPQKITFFLNRF
jgi:hypothetical protein